MDITIQVTKDFAGWRLDIWLAEILKQPIEPQTAQESSYSDALVQSWQNRSRTQVQSAIKQGCVCSSDGAKVKAKRIVQAKEYYILRAPENDTASYTDAKPVDSLEIDSKHIPIVYEDESFLVLHKPAGLSMYSNIDLESQNSAHFSNDTGPPQQSWSILSHLKAFWAERGLWKSAQAQKHRYGIVHRLDKDTEGLLLAAKDVHSQSQLMQLFKQRSVGKEYLAWTWNTFREPEGESHLRIQRHSKHRMKMQVMADQSPIALSHDLSLAYKQLRIAEAQEQEQGQDDAKGRLAVTRYSVLDVLHTRRGHKFSKILFLPKTGRTHQIRVHAAYYQAPIVGDLLYSRNTLKKLSLGLMLFAQRLSFVHPHTQERMDFALAVPERFDAFPKQISTF